MANRFTKTDASAVNSALTVTQAGEDGRRHYLLQVIVSWEGAAVDADTSIKINFGEETIYHISAGTREKPVFINFPIPLIADKGQKIDVITSAAGGSVVVRVNILGYTI